jgi:phage shock protein PspC (stress-responsive transcriptional regulator)
VLGGVAALLGGRLGVDALWIRIGFVLLALVGGVGLLVYLALWLGLVRGADHPVARVAGGVLLLAGLPFLLLQRGDRLFSGPWAMLALLAGLAFALWQPHRAPAPARPAPASIATTPVAAPPPGAPRPPRPPSILGRLTLGIAALVAAGGALVDQANGGRLHPEQWLGAGAVVCGIGLLVGAVAGRARWLVVPAVLFAGAGLVAGESARVGLHPTALTGTRSVYLDAGVDTTAAVREHVVAGNVDVQIAGAPRQQVAVDARVGFGDVRVFVADGVTVELRTHPGDGEVRVDGVAHPAGTFTVGPAGRPAVVVDARVGHGDIAVDRYSAAPEAAPDVKVVPGDGQPTDVAEGVAVTGNGSIALAGGEALIDPDDRVVVGEHFQQDQVTVITTSGGEFKLLPGGLLLTPTGELLDLTAVRASVDTPVPPAPTAPPAPPPTGG